MQQSVHNHFDFLYKHTGSGKEIDPKVRHIASHVGSHYRKTEVEKGDGGCRVIYKPSREIKTLQDEILGALCAINRDRNIIPQCVFGLGGDTVRQNVLPHRLNRYVLKVDIENFFDNVNYKRVRRVFMDIGCTDEESEILTKLTTYNYHIPQGVSASSMLASLCLRNCDRRIEGLCKKLGVTYTRYVDDMTISCKRKMTDETQCNVRTIISREGFRMNDKTMLVDTRNEPCVITGVILQDRKMLTEYHHGQKKHDFIKSSAPIMQEKMSSDLRGVLEWIRGIDPHYHNTLIKLQRCPFCV